MNTTGFLTGILSPSAAQFAAALPAAASDWARLAAPPPTGVQVTWVGHACALVQLEGVTVLTDPALQSRCSPISFLGPKRLTAPALDLFDARCPRPDAVLLSHNHYDHLCEESVEQLQAAFGAGGGGKGPLRWFVPLGLKDWFAVRGIHEVTELDWWQEAELKAGVRVACTPAQHWSSRSAFDRNASLWCSWVVRGERRRLWFGGDSGYCSVFKEIGARHGPFDLSLIPIGAYHPRWFHGPAHMDPREAVQVHLDVRSKRTLPIHWGCWSLTDEPLDEPPVVLREEARAAGLNETEFSPLLRGETAVVTAD